MAAFGGALVLGALPRFMRNPRSRYALLMAIGAVMLAYTRPYEGVLLCLPVLLRSIHWFLRAKNRPPAAVLFRRTAVPVSWCCVGGAAWLELLRFPRERQPFDSSVHRSIAPPMQSLLTIYGSRPLQSPLTDTRNSGVSTTPTN